MLTGLSYQGEITPVNIVTQMTRTVSDVVVAPSSGISYLKDVVKGTFLRRMKYVAQEA